VACFVYEERRPAAASDPWFPSRELRDRFEQLGELHRQLNEAEQAARLPLTRAPDAGFTAMAAAWAAGGDLDEVLRDEEITAGDFVRTAKQLIDLLRQLATVATAPGTRRAAGAAADALFRGVVAASSMIDEPDEDDELPGEGPLGGDSGG
jgi:ATP-dependent RNA helicase HelY